MRQDWMTARIDVMRKAVYAKFTQDLNLKALLLSTHDHLLVQIKPGDDTWGTGPRGDGANMLGVLLMELRSQLQAEGQAQ